MSIISAFYGNVASPVYTGCICKLHPVAAREDGCPEHGLQPLTDHVQNIRTAVKRNALHKILPRMTADEVATAERGLSEPMRRHVRLAWRCLRR